MTKEEKAAWMKNNKQIRQLGFGGVDRKGNLVDRRLNPEATPIKQNKMFNIPAPKDICPECNGFGLVQISPDDYEECSKGCERTV